MIKPECVLVQEIRVVPAKAKITDMVALRHGAAGGTGQQPNKTTLMLLCEDGSLRIYMANSQQTGKPLSQKSRNPAVFLFAWIVSNSYFHKKMGNPLQKFFSFNTLGLNLKKLEKKEFIFLINKVDNRQLM